MKDTTVTARGGGERVYRELDDLADVEVLRESIEEFASELWDTDADTGKVEWEDWLDRFESTHMVILPSQLDDPIIVKVKRIARQAIREVIG